MSLAQPPTPQITPDSKQQSAKTKALKTSLRALLIVLLAIPVFLAWQALSNRYNNTDPTIAGRPLSNQQTHLHTVAVGGRPGVLYLGTHYGIFTSSDGGRSWPQARGSLNRFMIISIAVSPVDPQALALISHPTSGLNTQGGLYFSADGGKNWRASSTPDGLSATAYLFAVQAGTGGAGQFYAYYVSAGWFETRDMGMHWRLITDNAVTAVQSSALLTDAAHPDHLLLGDDNGIFESRDDGNDWRQLTTVQGSVLSLVASNTTPRLVFCLTDQGIYRWRDGSAQVVHLVNLPMPVPPTRLATIDGNTLYAVSGQDLWSSTDAGATWKRLWGFERNDLVALVIDPFNPAHLYAGFFLPAEVMDSVDGGQSWQTLTD